MFPTVVLARFPLALPTRLLTSSWFQLCLNIDDLDPPGIFFLLHYRRICSTSLSTLFQYLVLQSSFYVHLILEEIGVDASFFMVTMLTAMDAFSLFHLYFITTKLGRDNAGDSTNLAELID
jgi:hypothetical protein